MSLKKIQTENQNETKEIFQKNEREKTSAPEEISLENEHHSIDNVDFSSKVNNSKSRNQKTVKKNGNRKEKSLERKRNINEED